MALSREEPSREDRPVERFELPPEAGDIDAPRFEPNEAWLRGAPPELQIRAMRRWFEARYQDPQFAVPHDEGEGDYLYLQGGPFHPAKVLRERFGALVGEAAIAELAEALRREVGDDWAPLNEDPGVTS